MPMTQVIQINSGAKLLPLYDACDAIELPINLAPSTTFAQGTVLGQITSSANDVQTITAPGSGTYTLTFTNPLTGTSGTTSALAFGANDAAVLAALQPVVTSTGGGTVAVSSLAVTFSGALAARPVPLLVASAGSVAHTTTGRTAGTYTAYNETGTDDGHRVARCILPYACATDASGNIYLSSSAGSFFGESYPSISAYFGGYFDTTKLVGLDANGAADLGKLISGTATAGVLCVTGS